MEQLQNVDTAKLKATAKGWGAVSRRSGEATRRVDNGMVAQVRDTQKSEAGNAAVESAGLLSRNFQYIRAECGLIETAINGLADELAGPQRKLKQALEHAKGLNFTVHPDGSVDYPRASVADVPAPVRQAPARPGQFVIPVGPVNPLAAKAREVADTIADALKEAAEIDARYAKALLKLTTSGDIRKTDWLDVAQDMKDVRSAARRVSESDIPKGKSPRDNAAWWKNLSQTERDEYKALYPAGIGALDGLPAIDRDDANRVVLAESRASTMKELEELKRHEPKQGPPELNQITGLPVQGKESEWSKWNRRKEALEGRIKGIKSIQRRFDETGTRGLPEAYLMAFDDRGLGRAVVASGNPDTAQHTAVYVPGTSSRFSAVGKEVDRMSELWRQSHTLADGESVSTIAWVGYDAPRSAMPFDKGDFFPEAMSKAYARGAADDLSGFLDGVQTAQGGPEKSHTTVMGHSYGSTAIGATSLKHHLGADDIIAVASPGMLVRSADELGAPHGHVWSEAASIGKDQVPAGGKLVDLGGPMGGLVPSDREFGANIMQTDAHDHGSYFDKDSLSLRNMAAVVTGNYEEVKRD
ncbi:alpha/beta hydrolase [Streptomyces sp. I05A-00742]|uniref:alpha/beta hydrolase n=1 Tax=Streptomyces sp. I05A-00742 TaxID=2732853 RepID=UPI001488978C|nr:alpha/beta hydrolase [Streptomyces sp. I05A-00742]